MTEKCDVRADDLGSWNNRGVKTSYFSVSFSSNGKINRLTSLGSRKPSVLRSSIYMLKRTYWKHSEDPKFSRRLFELQDHEQNHYHIILLQYFHPTTAVEDIGQKPHRNSKCGATYIRTKQSVRHIIIDTCKGW
ncbi:PREDICTED: uncharacterized protein LOC109588081 [Amphimedon queenslandica]|uniref:Uncharacterized protein n=1 Tax=Amphimedon queenslandica TaxID=400682 RepID=A0AAN0JSM8_AMPQE|nr:PREDICTED: uncharacterized protein LOC109588081 [Amphimedon queenslandica]|eukprot:XP_019859828.1 PREDICTED: uncharacterized protein LOC109588081 [Amphimedon queenslandica]